MGDIIHRLVPNGGDGTYKYLTDEEATRAIDDLLRSRAPEFTPEPMIDDLIAELDALKFLATFWKLWASKRAQAGWSEGELVWTSTE